MKRVDESGNTYENGMRKALVFAVLVGCVVRLFAVAPASGPQAITVVVSPTGNDTGDGSLEHPFETLERAQQAVRENNELRDVNVQLTDGIYRLARPLRFSARDGGRNGHRVVWMAATGASPVISGGIPIHGWNLWDAKAGIYVADVPVGLISRELWVNDHLAPMAKVELRREDCVFSREGISLKPGVTSPLPGLDDEAAGLE